MAVTAVRAVDGLCRPGALFRLRDFSTVLVCTERFHDACQRLGLEGVKFLPLPTA